MILRVLLAMPWFIRKRLIVLSGQILEAHNISFLTKNDAKTLLVNPSGKVAQE